jgi:YVTN family beta-propeller protein
MLESDLRALFERQAASDLPPAPISIPAIYQSGRARLRWHRAGAIGSPLLAAGAVLALALSGAVPAGLLRTAQAPAAGAPALRPTAYVLTTAGNVVPVNLATNRPGHAIHAVHRGAYGGLTNIAVTPDGRTVYVSGTGEPTSSYAATSAVTPIDVATGRVGQRVLVPSEGGLAGDIAILPNGKTAYVLDAPQGIVPVDLASGTALRPISVSDIYSLAADVAIAPNGQTAYAVEPALDKVIPIRTATSTPLKPITLTAPGSPLRGSIAITPDGKTAYVLRSGQLNDFRSGPPAGALIPISTATNTALRPISLKYFAGGLDGIAISPDGRTVYVASARWIVAISTSASTMVKAIRIPAAAAGPVTIDPDGRTAYVLSSESDTVTPIDLATNTALKPIGTAGLPVFCAFSPDGKTAYVGTTRTFTGGHGAGRDAVIPIQTATDQVGKPINVGGDPAAIAIAP